MTRWKGRDQERTSYSLAVTAALLVLITKFFFENFPSRISSDYAMPEHYILF